MIRKAIKGATKLHIKLQSTQHTVTTTIKKNNIKTEYNLFEQITVLCVWFFSMSNFKSITLALLFLHKSKIKNI